MEDYKPNSHKFNSEKKEPKEERKKLAKVVNGDVKTRKKSGAHKLAEVFIAEDVSNVKNYLLMDVLIPALKNTIEDLVVKGIRGLLGNDPRGSKGTASKITYDRFYGNGKRDERPSEHRTRAGYSYDEVVLTTRGEAEDVLSRLDEAIDTYGMVTVADLYDLVGITGSYTDNNYGWTNLRNAEAIRVRDGYWLKLPKALPISQIK